MKKTSSFKKAPLKNHRALDPIKISPFVVPTTIRKEAPKENAPIGATPLKAVTNHFPRVGGNRTTDAPEVVYDPTQGDEDVKTSSPNDTLKASLSPLEGRLRSFGRDWLTNKCSNNVLNIITTGYILPFISRPNFVKSSPDSLSSVKEHNRKGGKCKISRILVACF